MGSLSCLERQANVKELRPSGSVVENGYRCGGQLEVTWQWPPATLSASWCLSAQQLGYTLPAGISLYLDLQVCSSHDEAYISHLAIYVRDLQPYHGIVALTGDCSKSALSMMGCMDIGSKAVMIINQS